VQNKLLCCRTIVAAIDAEAAEAARRY